MPRPVKILMPMWGDRHVKLFLDLILPTWLAPGNLPLICRSTTVEAVFLTPRDHQDYIRGHAGFPHLSAVASVRFEDIDDLMVPRNHSTVLTLAWARAVRALGAAATETNLLLLLPDLLIADGTLSRLVDKLEAGRRAVQMGSLQIVLEDTLAELQQRVDRSTWQLRISARELVGYSLNYVHPNLASSFVDQPIIHSRHPYFFFWRVDESTVVARHFNLALIAVRPETVDFEISAPLDMSFPPEFCPSGDIEIVADSDDCLLTEIAFRGHEMVFLAPGPIDAAEAASSLDRWTTREQRRASEVSVVFHENDRPPGLDAVLQRADAFMQHVRSAMGPDPVPHRDHPYWHQQFTSFQLERRPPRNDAPAAGAPSSSVGLQRLAWSILGRPPVVRRWHPAWADYAPLMAVVEREWLGTPSNLIAIANDTNAIVDWIARRLPTQRLSFVGALMTTSTEPIGGALLLLEPGDLARLGGLLAGVAPRVPPGAAICLHVFNRGVGPAHQSLPLQLAAQAGYLCRRDLTVEACHFSAGRFRRLSRSLYEAAVRAITRGGRTRMVGAAGLLITSCVLALVDGLMQRDDARPSGHCSSITIVLRRRAAAAASSGPTPVALEPAGSADARRGAYG